VQSKQEIGLTCPMPLGDQGTILLGHGGGGRLMQLLLEKVFLPAFDNPVLAMRHDGAVLDVSGVRLAFTTDSYVVRPLFFPGGDIGTLAVNGTVNDLAMCGARPAFLSAGFVLEEGFPLETLRRVVQSMRQAAEAAGVQFVCGDTKVVDRGKGDGVFINASGIGVLAHHLTIAPVSVRPGDVVLLNGDLGRHGIAIMAVREGLELEGKIQSDCASVAGLVMELIARGIEIHCLRDLTRGGLASALVEIAETAHLRIQVDENAIPICEAVQGACEILEFDPLYVANEGRFIAMVPATQAEQALAVMRAHSLGSDARPIGAVQHDRSGMVMLRSKIGATRILDMLSGEQLPRIC
jgi:hydrogenase expression/formation protein HypE